MFNKIFALPVSKICVDKKITRKTNTGNNPQGIPGYPIIFTGIIMFSTIIPLVKKKTKELKK